MPFYDPLAARFDNRPLDAWQLSKKNFDFDLGFVAWIRRYLETRKLPHDVLSAKAWINKSKFNGERYELCELQWEAYREELQFTESKPVLRVVGGDCDVPSGGGDGANQSGVDCAVDAVMRSPLPPDMEEIEGESDADRAVRCRKYVQEKLKKMTGSKW
jgi:hypothetical protein